MVELDVYTKLSNRFARLEKHCVSLELDIQLNQQILQKDKSCENQNAPEFSEFFENNNLKAQLQEKDTTINKLRNHIKSLQESDKNDRVKQYMDETETINIKLEHSVAKLLSENELLHKEIEHLKKIYKDQFDSIKKTCALSKEHCDSLIAQLNSKSMENTDLKGQIQEKVFVTTSLQNELRRLKGKNVLDNATTITNATTIAPVMFKRDLEPLSPKLLNNREAHIHYLKTTKKQADILRGIVEQSRYKQPLDSVEKFIAVTPMNKIKKVRFSEPLTSSSNIHNQVESSKTPDSNTPVLPSTGLKSSTSASRSQPTGNKKNDRISQTHHRNMKNKVEVNKARVTPLDIQHSAATQIWGCYRLVSEPVIMSFATSAVTYTSVYTNSELSRAFWGADDEKISGGDIPRVIVLGYNGLPMQPVAPPSLDYIPGPEDPQTPPVPQDEDEREPMFVQAHDPDYVPEPIYPEYIL
ncbi:hypothetical protein Tco_0811067 [Tanacetum coccineum]